MSVYANISGARVSRCDLAIPYWGLWVADVELPVATAIPAQCTLTIADLTLTGHVARTDSFAGLRTARIVGGFGGWPTSLDPREYANPTGVRVSTILGDAAGDVGERVKVADDSSVGSYFLRERAPAARLLRQLSGALWWIDPSGVTQIGTARSEAAVSTAFLIEQFDPATGRIFASTENPLDWQPGRSVSNKVLTTPRTLGFVRHVLDNDGTLRTEALAA
jgi:hypothetical protein